MVILAALNGYHSTKANCRLVAIDLSDLATYQITDPDTENEDIDFKLKKIREFRINCEKKQ